MYRNEQVAGGVHFRIVLQTAFEANCSTKLEITIFGRIVQERLWPRENVMSKLVKSAVGPNKSSGAVTVETVADILDRELPAVIDEWLVRVEKESDLMSILMNYEDRTGHLPHLIHDVIRRLRLDVGTRAPISKAAAEHGDLRRKQGYTVAMMVEESRLLQVSIFTTLHQNVKQLEFSALLPIIVTIADEVDAQLKEQMLRFMAADVAKAAKGK